MVVPASRRLIGYLASAWGLLALYGGLYPFSNWRDTGVAPLAFLQAAWPRYVTGFDLLANTLAYLPLGLFLATLLTTRWPRWAARVASTLLAASLSLFIELLQNYLPSRVPSHVDLLCNTLGAALGAWLAAGRLGRLLTDAAWGAWRAQRWLPGRHGDLGLLLLAGWLLTQLNAETFLFGNGNLRALLGLPAALPFAADRFFEIEMATVAAHGLAIVLIAGELALRSPRRFALGLLALALLIKTLALMVLMQGRFGLAWATPGSLAGLGLGLMAWSLVWRLGTGGRRALAALALMLASVLANLMPDNPYLADTLRVWQQGHFLNFNGATRLASSLWPFLALLWLTLSRNLPDEFPAAHDDAPDAKPVPADGLH